MKKALITLLTIILFTACSKSGTETGNPRVTMTIASFSPSSTNKVGALAIAGTTFCFKRLRFKTQEDDATTNPETDEDNIDLTLGRVSIDPTGTSLSTVSVPAATYTRIEFDLESDCEGTTAPSVTLDNDNDGGTPFETNDRITIKFEGDVTITSDSNLSLELGTIINALNAVTTDNEIKTRLEDINTKGAF